MLPSIFNLIEGSFKLYTSKIKHLIPLLLALFLVSAVSNIVILNNDLLLEGTLPRKQIALIALGLVVLLLLMNYITYIIQHALRFDIDKKQGLLYHARQSGMVFVQTIIVSLIVAIITGIGTIFFIIPGIIFLVLFFFAKYYTLFEAVPIVESLKRSYHLTKDRWGAVAWRLFAPIIIIAVFSIAIGRIINFGVVLPLIVSSGATDLTKNIIQLTISSLVSTFFYPWIYGAPIMLFVSLQHVPKK